MRDLKEAPGVEYYVLGDGEIARRTHVFAMFAYLPDLYSQTQLVFHFSASGNPRYFPNSSSDIAEKSGITTGARSAAVTAGWRCPPDVVSYWPSNWLRRWTRPA